MFLYSQLLHYLSHTLESRSITSLEKKDQWSARYRSVRHESESPSRLTGWTLASPRSSQRCVTGSARGNAFAKSKSELFPLSPCRTWEWERSEQNQSENSETFSIFVRYTGWVGQHVGRYSLAGLHIRGAGPGVVRATLSCHVTWCRADLACVRTHMSNAYEPQKLGQVRERGNARSERLTKVAFLRERIYPWLVSETWLSKTTDHFFVYWLTAK